MECATHPFQFGLSTRAGTECVGRSSHLIPFVRQFYDSPSTFLWEDETGEVKKVVQGEGGEQGNPMLGQHRALVSIQAQLKVGERLFAFFDDIYVVCSPDRVGEVYTILEKELRQKPGINNHQGKIGVYPRTSRVLRFWGADWPSFVHYSPHDSEVEGTGFAV